MLGFHALEARDLRAVLQHAEVGLAFHVGLAEGPEREVLEPVAHRPREDRLRLRLGGGDRFRLVANEVDLVPPDEELPRLPVARAVWKPKPDFATATEAWLLAGGPHHTVLSQAVGNEDFPDLAEIAGLELLLIDEVMTPDSSRFWPKESYAVGRGQPSLDKQPIRDWLDALEGWDKTPPGWSKSGIFGSLPFPSAP